MSIKLIASDIDGTIINENREISKRTRDVIQRLKDHDIRFTFATGRSFDSTYLLAQSISNGDDTYGLICLNGQETYEFPSLIKTQKETLTFEESVKMMELGEKFYLGIMYCYDDVIYFQMDDLSYRDYMIAMGDDVKRFFNMNIETVEIKSVYDIQHRFETDRIQKIAYIQAPQYMDLVVNRMRESLDEKFELLQVGPGWTEVAIHSVTKGAALIEYAAKYGITPDEIMVFGDSENDISMLKIAKVAVVMENGMESAKAHATDFTLSNDDDGVAVYIEKYLDSLK